MTDPESPPEPDLVAGEIGEAKAEIASLKAEKRQLGLVKKGLAAKKSEENARWRERQAGRLPMYRGGGSGDFIGRFVQNSRRAERMDHADRINEIVSRQAQVDARTREVDQRVLDLEEMIREHGPALKPPRKALDAAAAADPSERLRTLAALRDENLISEEEYTAKKADILDKL